MADSRLTFVVCGPSGVGKTTLVKRLLADVPGLRFSVSWTTRPPRSDEQDGVDYRFVDEPTFDEARERGWFLEHAHVHQHHYGTPWAELNRAHDQGCDAVLDIDVQGARAVRGQGLPGVFVLIAPPSMETLIARMRQRGTDTPAALEVRRTAAHGELAQSFLFDYRVVNDDLDLAYSGLRGIVTAERLRIRHG